MCLGWLTANNLFARNLHKRHADASIVNGADESSEATRRLILSTKQGHGAAAAAWHAVRKRWRFGVLR